MKKQFFTASYSGGKDSALALYRTIKEGHIPQSLLITYREDQQRSWFHSIPGELLEEVSAALEIPIRKIYAGPGKDYTAAFIEALREEREKGAAFCVFGDIDIEDHRSWCREACKKAGLEAYHPLWKESREALVQEVIREGFVANITTLDTTRLDKRFLGEALSPEIAEEIRCCGADVCGENGEYHTFVSNGPIFHRPISFSLGAVEVHGNYACCPLSPLRVFEKTGLTIV